MTNKEFKALFDLNDEEMIEVDRMVELLEEELKSL